MQPNRLEMLYLKKNHTEKFILNYHIAIVLQFSCPTRCCPSIVWHGEIIPYALNCQELYIFGFVIFVSASDFRDSITQLTIATSVIPPKIR